MIKQLSTKDYKHYLMGLGRWIYVRPLMMVVVLSLLSQLYLIADFGVVNRSSLYLLWALEHHQYRHFVGSYELGRIIQVIAYVVGGDYVFAAYVLMIVCHVGISLLLLLIAQRLSFSLQSQWALIFLLLSHPTYCDFRSYILIEPIFWLCWLLGVCILLYFYKKHTIISIFSWLIIFLLATQLSVAAWFWLLLFPFGTLIWRPWRRKSVAYALLGYAVVVSALICLPVYQGTSPLNWFLETVVSNPEPILEVLRLNNNNWIQEGDTLMSSIFILSGATSLVLVRMLISFGVASFFLSTYAMLKKQYAIIVSDYLRIIIYALLFDFFIAVILLILAADNTSVLSFSSCFLLLLFAALGLSYVFKKLQTNSYTRLSSLVIVWCLVAYFASGFIIFGPKRVYLKKAANQLSAVTTQTDTIYSNSDYFLFYTGKNPNQITPLAEIMGRVKNEQEPLYYAFDKNRHGDLPELLKPYVPLMTFANRHGDKVMIYKFQ